MEGWWVQKQHEPGHPEQYGKVFWNVWTDLCFGMLIVFRIPSLPPIHPTSHPAAKDRVYQYLSPYRIVAYDGVYLYYLRYLCMQSTVYSLQGSVNRSAPAKQIVVRQTVVLAPDSSCVRDSLGRCLAFGWVFAPMEALVLLDWPNN